jgi:stage III sporulation protein SpoIIIAA
MCVTRSQPRVSTIYPRAASVQRLTAHKSPSIPKDASHHLGTTAFEESIRSMISAEDDYHVFKSLLLHESPRVMDVAFDIGKPIVLHFDGVAPMAIPGTCIEAEHLEAMIQATETNDHIVHATGRAGVKGTLHRVSVLYDFGGSVVGATLRVGRHLNMHDVLPDDLKTVVAMGKSVLLFGPPGSGKTTLLRALAEFSGDFVPRRTIVVDSSGELGGAGTNVLGQFTRRACIPPGCTMPETMIQAIRNHTPQALIVDELVSVTDASAAQTCSARGIQLLASAHADALESLVQNPVFRDRLFGGIQYAAIGDAEAKMLGTKFVRERKSDPVFQAAYDCVSRTLYDDLVRRIDDLL